MSLFESRQGFIEATKATEPRCQTKLQVYRQRIQLDGLARALHGFGVAPLQRKKLRIPPVCHGVVGVELNCPAIFYFGQLKLSSVLGKLCESRVDLGEIWVELECLIENFLRPDLGELPWLPADVGP